MSCGSAGDCAAGGNFADRSLHFPGFPNSVLFQGFVVSERNGRWGKAIKVPGLLALSARGDAGVNSVSCGSAGDCAASGTFTYGNDPNNSQGFVAAERHGRWGRAIPVPGLRALNAGGVAFITSVSCGSAGNCAAGGAYRDGANHIQGFVVSRSS